MVAMNALPPVPAVFGAGWRDEWRERVERTEPWLLRWLRHQVDGPVWRQGSLRRGVRPPASDEGYERIECATMLVAGWADGYRNNTFRTFERLRSPKRLLLGPWAHQSPATAHPGPHVDLVVEMTRWFDRHLRGVDTGVDRDAPIQVFVRHATRPHPDLAVHDGEWRGEPGWPPARATTRVLRAEGDGIARVPADGDIGTTAWISCAGHLPWGQPSDQRADDARSLTFDWPVDEACEVLGHPRLHMRVRAGAAVATVSAKLCDVFPDGTSALVARGFLNLTHRSSSTDPEPLEPGAWYDVGLDLDATSWVFEPGHAIRLSLAAADWPNLWPPPSAVPLDLDRAGLALTLPELRGASPAVATVDLAEPRPADDGSAPGEEHEPVVWRVEHDVLDGVTRCVIAHGARYDGPHDARVRESYAGTIDVERAKPANAHADARARFEIAWPDTTAAAEVRLHLTSDADTYHVEVELDVDEGDAPFARRRWSEAIPRRLQ
jgi:predicted acyl esterase